MAKNVSRKGRPLREGEHEGSQKITCSKCGTVHAVFVSRRAYPGHESLPTDVRCVECGEVFTREFVPEFGGVEAWRWGTQPIDAKGSQRVVDVIVVTLVLLCVTFFGSTCHGQRNSHPRDRRGAVSVAVPQ